MEAEHDASRAKLPLSASDLLCERCGRPDSVEIGGRQLCAECYQIADSWCLEFGADDLWQENDAIK
jgi:hypothetical protein